MLSQSEVDQWLADFLKWLRKNFGRRLIFVGHHGSWAHGDAGATSDIDTIVILDHINSQDLSKVVHNLQYPFKCCVYALQSWILLCDGKFIARKDELFHFLSDVNDKEVIEVARDWQQLEQDREARPLYYIQLLERWGRSMLLRVHTYESNEYSKAR